MCDLTFDVPSQEVKKWEQNWTCLKFSKVLLLVRKIVGGWFHQTLMTAHSHYVHK